MEKERVYFTLAWQDEENLISLGRAGMNVASLIATAIEDLELPYQPKDLKLVQNSGRIVRNSSLHRFMDCEGAPLKAETLKLVHFPRPDITALPASIPDSPAPSPAQDSGEKAAPASTPPEALSVRANEDVSTTTTTQADKLPEQDTTRPAASAPQRPSPPVEQTIRQAVDSAALAHSASVHASTPNLDSSQPSEPTSTQPKTAIQSSDTSQQDISTNQADPVPANSAISDSSLSSLDTSAHDGSEDESPESDVSITVKVASSQKTKRKRKRTAIGVPAEEKLQDPAESPPNQSTLPGLSTEPAVQHEVADPVEQQSSLSTSQSGPDQVPEAQAGSKERPPATTGLSAILLENAAHKVYLEKQNSLHSRHNKAEPHKAVASTSKQPTTTDPRLKLGHSVSKAPAQNQQPKASTSKQPAASEPRSKSAPDYSLNVVLSLKPVFPDLSDEQIRQALKQEGGNVLRAKQQCERWTAKAKRNQVTMNPASQTVKQSRPAPSTDQSLHVRKKPRIDAPSASPKSRPIVDLLPPKNKGKSVANAFAPVHQSHPLRINPTPASTSRISLSSSNTSAQNSARASTSRTVFRETPPDSPTPPAESSEEEDSKPIAATRTSRRTSAGPRLHSQAIIQLVDRHRFSSKEDARPDRLCWCQAKTDIRDTYYPVIVKTQAPETIREADPSLRPSEKTSHSVMLWFPGENMWAWWDDWNKLLPLGENEELDRLLKGRAQVECHMEKRYDLAMGRQPNIEGITRWL